MDLWVGNRIPPDRIALALATHDLPVDTLVLVLYDDTLAGSPMDGFVVVPEGLAFRERGEAPVFFGWHDLASGQVNTAGEAVLLGERVLRFFWSRAHATALVAFVRWRVGLEPRLVEQSPSSAEWSAEAIVEVLRDAMGPSSAIWFHPDIPARAVRNARHKAQLADDEPILALVDRSILGAGRRGVVITSRRVSLLEMLFDPLTIAWTDVFNARIRSDGLLRIGPHELVTMDAQRLVRGIEALREALGGPEEERHPTLEEAIVDRPDDDALFAVYCDWLLERGAVRGRLGAAQHRGQTVDELSREHALELGLVFPKGLGELVRFRWRWGFWDEVHLLPNSPFRAEAYDVARQALRHPSGRFLRRLRVGSPRLQGPDLEQVLQALQEVELPCLSQLVIECPTGHVPRSTDLSRFPRLRRVTLDVGRVDPEIRRAIGPLRD